MTAPATWFALDVLTATSLDQAAKTLMIAPTLRASEQVATYPIFFPSFWAVVHIDRQTKSIKLSITSTFYEQVNGGVTVMLEKIVAQPIGKPTASGATIVLPAPFACASGAVLDLSSSWEQLVASSKILAAVLPTAPPH